MRYQFKSKKQYEDIRKMKDLNHFSGEDKMNEKYIEEFKQWQKRHPNFMTPEIISILNEKDFIIEVSQGEGMYHEPLFGVTVFKQDKDKGNIIFAKDNDFSNKNTCLFRKDEAINYAKEIQKEIRRKK